MAKRKKHSSTKASKSNKNTILILALIAISLTLLATLYKKLVTPAPIQVAQITNQSGSVNLTLSAESTNLKPNEETLVTLTYDTSSDQLSGIQAEIAYDPTQIEVSNVTLSDSLASVIQKPKVQDGKIKFAAGIELGENPTGLSGHGTLATFNIKALKNSTTNLNIQDTTIVITLGGASNTNMLREINNSTVLISDGNTTTSPSPSSSPSPAISASPSPSPSPSPKVNTSPSPSPSDTPDTSDKIYPSNPDNLKYNCYLDGNSPRITLRWNSSTNATSYSSTLTPDNGSDKLTDKTDKVEIDRSITGGVTYTWSLTAYHNSNGSSTSQVKDIKCATSSSNSTSPSPSATVTAKPTSTPAPSKKPLTQVVSNIFKKATPTPSATPKTDNNLYSPSPTTDPGTLSDIFATPEPTQAPQLDSPTLISKIFLGWKALILHLIESIAN